MQMLNLNDVMATLRCGRSTVYKKISDGLWPPAVKTGERSVRWPRAEVESMLAIHIAGGSQQAIKDRVKHILNARLERLEKGA